METKAKVIIGIVFTLIIGVFIFAWIRGGVTGFIGVVAIILKLMVWLGVIGLIGAIVYFLWIYEKKINARHEVYKNIVKETKINRMSNLKDLYTSGDSEHISFKIGKIVGYGARQNYDTKKGSKKDEFYYDESLFRVKRKYDNIILDIISLFLKRIIVRCPQSLHDRLQGDVSMTCTALVNHGDFFYPNSIHLNFKAIDKTIFNESLRYINMDVIKVAHPLLMKGMGVSKFDKRELEGARGIDMVRGNHK